MKGGKLRVLATAGSRRSPLQPEVPTIAEAGVPGYEMDSWLGIVAPAGTPSPVLDRLNAEFNRALGVPRVREKLAAQGLDVVGGSVADFLVPAMHATALSTMRLMRSNSRTSARNCCADFSRGCSP